MKRAEVEVSRQGMDGAKVSRILKAVDLFCGAGGTSQGAEQSGAAKVICAVNHWQRAVDTHSANFPHAQHINSRLDQVNPSECGKFDLLFASPECTHHSRARGGKPTSDQQRSGAWDLMRWVEYHRPSYLVVENVSEFAEWGPVDPKTGKPIPKFRGKFFAAWRNAIESAGYKVDYRILNAADFGAATSRSRIFVVARKGNRAIHWPEPTHGERVGGELPGMGGLKRWKSAAEIIDWSIPCKSVFLRSTPLVDATLARLEAGLRNLVGPYVVELRNNMTARGLSEPLSCVTAGGGHHGVAVPFQYQNIGLGAGRSRPVGSVLPTIVAARENHGVAIPVVMSSHSGGVARSVGAPIPTQTARGGVHFAVPYVVQFDNKGGANGADTRARSSRRPLHTITTKANALIAVPFVVTYYANGKAYPVSDPLCTLSTRDRCAIATAIIETAGDIQPRTEGERKLHATMVELGVADLGYRMFTNRELAAATSFPPTYIFTGNKGEVTKQIGNAVVPNVAEAITTAIAGAA